MQACLTPSHLYAAYMNARLLAGTSDVYSKFHSSPSTKGTPAQDCAKLVRQLCCKCLARNISDK